MLRLFKNKMFLLILATVLIFIVMGVTSSQDSPLNVIGNAVSVPLAPIQKFLSFMGQRVDDFFSYFRDVKLLSQENEVLKEKVSQLERENRELAGLREKNEELKAALKLKDHFDSYELIGANVIAKNPGNWFNTFKVDAGTKDGVTNDRPVLTSSKGLIGRVALAHITSSNVISIIDEESVISATVSKPGGPNVVVRGDINLKEQGLCRLDYIPFDADVEIGDLVETSGLGGIYPKGILIGKIVQIRKTSSEMDRYAIVEPVVDLKKIEEVFILTSKNK